MKEVLNSLQRSLASHYDVYEAQNMMKILAIHLLDITSIEWFTKDFTSPSQEQWNSLKSAVERLLDDEPLQYIIGEADFYGLTFRVNPSVLIPRPETEELIEWIIQEVHQHQSILDIGTGSGCIPITLKKNIPNSKVTSIDFSEEALQVATENALKNEVEVELKHDNALNISTEIKSRKWDIVVSNPPYIRQSEKVEMRDNVLLHEPDMALFVSNEDPLIFYREIAKYAYDHLNNEGLLFFEINQYLGDDTVHLLKRIGFKDITLRKDLSGNDRMIKAVYKK
ncbi:peptide chain release factor N(5)-glutamine methyltransferase [Halosquirtibacter laminarini]|uniref:Peptide chain release factor N(5)-glutamine methyltransferase n=1 Tax=Halosquirtibacter laminarini TaxID=3374600 RepID=A0AC61NNX8_9BACT|nr:peptide chain release factor N(5)-glutamine methyltransferase [Prolixibacteraceae bacterium]